MSYEPIYQLSIQYPVAAGAVLGAYYIVPYLLDPYDYRRRFSGPWLASFTNWWMANTVQGHNHSEVIRQLHDKHGTFVRIGPNHISIADPEAHEAVYGHSSGLLKTDFYDGFGGGIPSTFNATNKSVHATKRKRFANVFSMKSVLEFEPRVRRHILELCQQLDARCDAAAQGTSGVNWDVKNGKVVIDCCAQFDFLAFDIISDLAVGSSFGMVRTQRDAVPMALSQDLTEVTGTKTAETSVSGTLQRVLMMVMAVGVYPLWAQRILRLAPWNLTGTFALGRLFRLTVAAVNDRLRRDKEGFDAKEGVDIIDKLLPVLRAPESDLSGGGFIAEVLGFIAAGGDTTSK
ncbi:Benzoate 4-monooxygenase [Rhizoctonia solani AG-1 IB]|uniref:Benzoate 4-monooxygenase n=1 Tax=Thanatephorus cucumeris (strain AG1-IB / isolate 7/3/14) TaxID=1108050 RepID=M5BV61_THACB|nr:Benzoate 4-monooxygenase [Rhizoctonia solani AG-1 IB]